MRNPFRYFNSSPKVIRLTVMLYIRYPLSLRQVVIFSPLGCQILGDKTSYQAALISNTAGA